MELVYRELSFDDEFPVEPGEIIVRARLVEHKNRRDMASLLLEHGATALRQGAAPLKRIVLPVYPTLDDMLAATVVGKLLEGERLPAGLVAFARYAALVREGLQPSDVALHQSIEGIYLALRHNVAEDLSDEGVGRQFSAEWSRLADCIMQAAAEGEDPFAGPILTLANGAEFARERAFLINDRKVYETDVARGAQWQVSRLNGRSQGAALILHQPQSILWKHWSRGDPQSPTGRGYLLLVVNWGSGKWVISTDPVFKESLKSLADTLQATESREDTMRTSHDTWFDGKPFGHTLIASPQGGTALSDRRVLAIVKRWAGVPHKPYRFAAAAAVLALAAVFSISYWSSDAGTIVDRTDTSPVEQKSSAEETPNTPNAEGAVAAKKRGLKRIVPSQQFHAPHHLYVLAIGVSDYEDDAMGDLKYADDDARAFVEAFQEQAGHLFENVTCHLLVDEKATRTNIIELLVELKKCATQHDLVVLTVSGHGFMNDEGRYFFAPYDYKSDAPPLVSGVLWRMFADYVGKRSTAVVIMDTCHSGAVTTSTRRNGDPDSRMSRRIQNMLDVLSESDPGIVFFASSLREQASHETPEWQHGALSLAFLEGISGRHQFLRSTQTPLPQADEAGMINLKQLDYYVTERVKELAGGKQAVVTNHTGNMDLLEIPIAVRPAPNQED